MADRRSRQTKRQSTRYAKNRKIRRRSKTKLIICIVIEIVVLAILGIMIGWKYGISDWFSIRRNPIVKHVELEDIHSPNAVLMRVQGGKVIGEKNPDEIVYPASLTKIMTTILAIEELKDLNHEITITSEMVEDLYAQDASQAGFQVGENVRAIDLLYGVMLPSGADCCRALAFEIAGSEESFAERMNQKAEKLGLKNTHFCDTTGLHDPNHYSTANDIALLLKYALRNDTFREIIESSWHSTPGTNLHPDGITYYSTMFKNMEDTNVTGGKILGGKTGYTKEAGLCLASFAEIDGKEYILVTLGASENDQHFEDAFTIYNRIGTILDSMKS